MTGATAHVNDADYDLICKTVRRQSGIVLEDGKQYLVRSRLDALARKIGMSGIEGLVAAVRKETASGGLTAQVVEAMTTNESSFFRDVHPFDALRTAVLPDLIARRAKERRLTIWCAAASTGQEPYSLAMLLREHFAAQLSGWSVQFLATDLSVEVLERARAGRFGQVEIGRGLPATYLVKYFAKSGTEWVIRQDVRDAVTFRQLNLIEPWPPIPAADLVMMRNVLIYFDLPTKQTILGRVRKVIRPDGYFFLGGSETTLNVDASYRRETAGKSVFYRPGPAA